MRGLGQKRTDAARAEEFERKWGSVNRILWMKRQPSILSGETPCVNAHMGHEGMSRKGHFTTIVPLTDAEHREIHDHGIQTFCRKYSLTMDQLLEHAAAMERRWQAYLLAPDSPAW